MKHILDFYLMENLVMIPLHYIIPCISLVTVDYEHDLSHTKIVTVTVASFRICSHGKIDFRAIALLHFGSFWTIILDYNKACLEIIFNENIMEFVLVFIVIHPMSWCIFSARHTFFVLFLKF